MYKKRRYWNKGLTKETDVRIALAANKMSIAHMGQTPWNKGLTKETDSRLIEMGKKVSNEHMGKSSGMKGKHLTQETKDKCRKANLGRKPWNTGLTKETDTRVLAISNSQKEHWQDPEYAKKCLHRRTPSGSEQTFIDQHKEFRFVGNGQLVIGGKNPDFVSIINDHKLIEIWGEHYKIGRNPKDLIDFYKVRGYECLIIWAEELRHLEKIAVRVKKFMGGDTKCMKS